MAEVKHHSSAEEKLRIIKAYMESGKTMKEFAECHEICYRTLKRWIDKYEEGGASTLKNRADKAYEKIAPHLRSDAELRQEILKLRIENERFKKSYAVRTLEDGRTEYIRLRPKNSK